MIKKRLLGLVPESKKYIALNVLFQWLGMCSNIIMIYTIAYLLDSLRNGQKVNYEMSAIIIVGMILIRVICILNHIELYKSFN